MQEHYFDDWEWRDECLMKMRFRSKCDNLNFRLSMLQATPVQFSHCPCCRTAAPETIDHFLLHCPAYAVERSKMYNRTMAALHKFDDDDSTKIKSHDFNAGPLGSKLLILLGKRSGLLAVDRSIDRACKKFLRAASKTRDQFIIAAN